MKKIVNYVAIFICLLINLSSCSFIKSYSFKDITNHDITEISLVSYSQGPIQPSRLTYNGDISKYLNGKYNKVYKNNYVDYMKLSPGYSFAFFVEIDTITYDFILNNGSFYVTDINNNLYKTADSFDIDVILNEIQNIEKTMIVEVTYDYGMHIENEVSVLLNGCLLFFNIKEYNIDKLVGGDYLIINYTGEFMIKEIYPAIFEGINFSIISIELYIPHYIEYEVILKDGNKILKPVDDDFNNYLINTKYVVNEDYSFIAIDDLQENSLVYGANPSYYSSLTIPYLFSYLPRN